MKEKIKQIFKDKKWIIIVSMLLILAFINLISISKFMYLDRKDYKDNYISNDKILKKEGNVVVTQEFEANINNMKGIELGINKSFRTYNNANIDIKIIEIGTEKIIGEYNNIYNNINIDETKYVFNFQKQKDSFGKKYQIIIKYLNGTKENPIYYTNENKVENGNFKINDNQEKGNLSFAVLYENNIGKVIFFIGLFFINIITIIELILVYLEKINIKKSFIMIVMISGLFYICLVPMYRSYDEHAHFFKAYEISEGKLITPLKDGWPITEIPKGMTETLHSKYDKTDRYFIQTYFEDIIRTRNIKLDYSNKVDIGGEYMAVYSPLPYLPQVIAIKFIKVFTNKLILIFYFTRLINLIISICIVTLALKIIPFGKKYIMFIVLFPTTLAIFSSCSPDAITITCSILYFSYFLKLKYQEEKINRKQILIISLLGLCIGLMKIVYIPFVFLILLINKEKFKNKMDKKILIVFGIILPILFNILWLVVAGKYLSIIDNNKSNVQKNYILNQPMNYLRICAFTLYKEISLYLNQMFGGYMEHIEMVKVGDISMILYIPMLVILCLLDNEVKNKFNKKITVVVLLIVLSIIGLIFTSLYMQWSSYKNYFINGIQGRYFIEIMLPIMLVLGQYNCVKLIRKINLEKLIFIFSLFINMLSMSTCLVTYI